MEGGTFTISNGGVFGSMFGTPIINPPQSAILGMHATMERPVAVNGKVSTSLAGCLFCQKGVGHCQLSGHQKGVGHCQLSVT